MRFAVVGNCIVENIVIGDRSILESFYPFPEYDLINADEMQCGIGWVYTDGHFEPRETRSIEEIKADKLTELNQACQAEITNGFESDALGYMHRYSSQLEDQINLIGATIGAIAGNSIAYICLDLVSGEKTARVHSPEQMQQVMIAGKRIKEAAVGKFHELRSQAEAAESIAEIQAIQW